MELLGSTESKITNDENDENVPYLEINEILQIHYIKFIIFQQQLSARLKSFAYMCT